MKTESEKWIDRFLAEPEATLHEIWAMGRCMRRDNLIRILRKKLPEPHRTGFNEKVHAMILAENSK